jgi:hypothetical protein
VRNIRVRRNRHRKFAAGIVVGLIMAGAVVAQSPAPSPTPSTTPFFDDSIVHDVRLAVNSRDRPDPHKAFTNDDFEKAIADLGTFARHRGESVTQQVSAARPR